MTTLTAILTSYNRRDSTLECLARLETAARIAGIAPKAVLVDDASTDGTADAVAGHFPWVRIERGDGALFWNRGMHRAQAVAMQEAVDFLLWINDDTLLVDDALVRLLATHDALMARDGRPAIIVGATVDRVSGAPTYGGAVAVNRLRRFTYRRLGLVNEPTECEVMNGNVVLLPMAVARVVGNLDPVFEHAMGDTDYALRARKAGFRVAVAPGFVGHCANNPTAGSFLDASLPFRTRWAKMLSRKGLPLRSWMHFTRRHGGWAWPLYFVWPYARLLASALRTRPAAEKQGRAT